MQKNLRFIFIMFFITLLMSCSEEKADPVGLNGYTYKITESNIGLIHIKSNADSDFLL
jgi:hypothetical protein